MVVGVSDVLLNFYVRLAGGLRIFDDRPVGGTKNNLNIGKSLT